MNFMEKEKMDLSEFSGFARKKKKRKKKAKFRAKPGYAEKGIYYVS